MTMPTAIEILSIYLYGTKKPPVDLKAETLIRPPGPGKEVVKVDMNEFMTTGGGRFVKVENFRFVRNFLAGNDAAYVAKTLPPGIYTATELLNFYGVEKEKRNVGIQQYALGLRDTDYIDRAYVFGSGEFRIKEALNKPHLSGPHAASHPISGFLP